MSRSADPLTVTRRLRARAYLFLLATHLLRLAPPRRLPALLEPRRRASPPDDAAAAAAAVAIDALLASGGRFLPRGCLARGMALYRFLRRAGLDVSLTFGVDPSGNDPPAHCWLTRDGRPYLESIDPAELFVPVWTIEHGGGYASARSTSTATPGSARPSSR